MELTWRGRARGVAGVAALLLALRVCPPACAGAPGMAPAATAVMAATPAKPAAPSVTPHEVDRSKRGWDRAPVIRLPVPKTPPKIDGDLSDPCWREAYHDEKFWNSDADRAPQQRTELWLCADARALYVAAYMHDTSPRDIRAQETKRNGALDNDDLLEILIDPTYKLGGLYSFGVNPRGAMRENVPGGSDAKVEWHGDWSASARILPDGWTAEAAIPWGVLRYPHGQGEIALCVRRYVARTLESTYWPDMGPAVDLKEFAHIIGLSMPSLSRPWLVMPTVQTEWTTGHLGTHVSVDATHAFDNGLSVVATLEPDFRNIENEVTSLDFSYTEHHYDDRRPFFTTGQGYMPDQGLLYSLRIPDLDAGLKVFGKTGRTSVGLMQTSSFGHRSDTAAHINQQLDDEWSLDSEYVGTSQVNMPGNHVVAGGLGWGRVQGAANVYANVGGARSSTAGAPDGNVLTAGAGWYGGEGRWSFNAGYQEVSPTFISLDGYIPETDLRGWSVSANYNAKPKTGPIKTLGAYLGSDDYMHYDGSLFHRSASAYFWADRKQHDDGISFGQTQTHRPPNHDHTTSASYWWGEGQLHKGGSVGYSWGNVDSADYGMLTASVNVPLGKRLYSSFTYERRTSLYHTPAIPDVCVGRFTTCLNYDLDPERGFAFEVRSGTQGTNFFGTYRQSVRRGTDWFLIFGDPNTDHTVPRLGIMTKWVWRK